MVQKIDIKKKTKNNTSNKFTSKKVKIAMAYE